MSAFLENYEDVNTRIKRFRAEFPSARMVSVIEAMDLAAGWILFKAEIYREYEDLHPSSVGYAYGHVATYPANMKKWYVEDTETSSYGRAIAALIPVGNSATRENMARVEYEATPSKNEPDLWATLTVKQTEVETGTAALGSTLTLVKDALETPPQVEAQVQAPHCRHGQMSFKSGTSAKTGKDYTGYTCTFPDRDQQCKAIWL